MSFIKGFINDESGATAVEYGLIAALVSVAAIVALQTLGDELKATFRYISCQLGAGRSSAAADTFADNCDAATGTGGEG